MEALLNKTNEAAFLTQPSLRNGRRKIARRPSNLPAISSISSSSSLSSANSADDRRKPIPSRGKKLDVLSSTVAHKADQQPQSKLTSQLPTNDFETGADVNMNQAQLETSDLESQQRQREPLYATFNKITDEESAHLISSTNPQPP